MDNELLVGTRSAGPVRSQWVLRHGRLLAISVFALIALLALGLQRWDEAGGLEGLATLGYPGVFLMMLLSGTTIFFPALGQAVVLAAGAMWNPLLVGLAAGLGNATGELTGYFAGRAGAIALGKRQAPRWWSSLQGYLRRYGFFAVLIMAAVPNPMFDAIGILAGSLSYPSIRRFWLACAIGNTIKYVGMAYLGDVAIGLWPW